MSIQSEVELLIEPLKHSDPRTWQALQALNRQLQLVIEDIEPIVRQSQLPGGGITVIDPPTGFICFSTGPTLRFTWNQALEAVRYEVRKGTSWDTADFQFRTTNLTADIDPVAYGTHNYLIKSMDNFGAYSITSASASFTVAQIPAPAIISSVIDNNVLLIWTIPTSTFTIKHYIIKKEGVPVGLVVGTFMSFFETMAGTFLYSVTAVDRADNIGDEATVAVLVNAPPDFALQDRRVSDLMGTRVNVLRVAGPKLLCTWTPTTWQDHFVTRSWDQPSDQVAAGFPIYIQPSAVTGSYEEIFDYSVVINNLIVNCSFNVNLITVETVGVAIGMAVSEDGLVYTPLTYGASQFFPTFRYLKLRLEFTAPDQKALIELYNLTLSIDVKRENDGGEVNALASDVNGTLVYFQKPFKDVESITTTVKSTTEPFIAIFVFNDVPSPTSFTVFAFDSTGNRVTKVVDWKARGIV